MIEYGILNIGLFWECMVGEKVGTFSSLEEAANWIVNQ